MVCSKGSNNSSTCSVIKSEWAARTRKWVSSMVFQFPLNSFPSGGGRTTTYFPCNIAIGVFFVPKSQNTASLGWGELDIRFRRHRNMYLWSRMAWLSQLSNTHDRVFPYFWRARVQLQKNKKKQVWQHCNNILSHLAQTFTLTWMMNSFILFSLGFHSHLLPSTTLSKHTMINSLFLNVATTNALSQHLTMEYKLVVEKFGSVWFKGKIL